MARTVRDRSRGGSLRRTPSGCGAADHRHEDRGSHCAHPGDHATRRDALEYARNGQGDRLQPYDHQPCVARRAFGLQPHRMETFKLSPDPLLIEKVRDIVGLYMNPPDHAVVLCVDEKSQIQALDRTAPLLPMRPGQAERRTHDYKRHGTTSLFAALDAKTGTVVAETHRRHRSREFRKFLDRLEANVPADREVHIILDNYGTHKTPLIRAWLAKRPRFHVHFTPTYASWLNLVERWFAELTTKQLRRGAHRSVGELERAIEEFIDVRNKEPKPFVWTKSAVPSLPSSCADR